MNRKPIVLAVLVLAVAVVAFWAWKKAAGHDAPVYRFATIERGNLEAAVSATGTLSAVTTVQVGTQVSGKIVEIKADFNDRVKKGQLVARIDPTILEQQVRDAQAGLERSQAELEQAQLEFKRNEGLFERKVLTEIEFNNAKYALAVARANVKSAQVALDRAKQNLAYTQIYAPIDGIVVERNVDVGQTVVASMSTPQLFLIAQDLSQMQILASVDESDIGAIHEGQDVRFSVQAYPNRKFTGKVKQVRLQSKTTENVVNYTVVVLVANNDGKLLPGMTATLEFLTGTATDALLVANSALRFRPTDEMRAEVMKRLREARAASGKGDANGAPAAPGPGSDAAGSASGGEGRFFSRAGGENGMRGLSGPNGSAGFAGGRFRNRQPPPTLWYLDEAGRLTMTRVHAGLTDGQKTVVESPRIKEGMQVIIGVNESPAAQNRATPFGGPPGGVQFRRPGF
ncbi:MAG TPA: efflux RND transporter periplasmic adaptor subunit [Steroidobacteraceae bacterium]|nr:efflux RND transporter periplasmic adaptor subunit [Steroidobacteraceae bacterium]